MILSSEEKPGSTTLPVGEQPDSLTTFNYNAHLGVRLGADQTGPPTGVHPFLSDQTQLFVEWWQPPDEENMPGELCNCLHLSAVWW